MKVQLPPPLYGPRIYKVILDKRSIFVWPRQDPAIGGYNPITGSAHLYDQFTLDKTTDLISRHD